jgi:hypothetical protein
MIVFSVEPRPEGPMKTPDSHLDLIAGFIAGCAGSTSKARIIYILETLADRLKRSPVNKSVEDVMREFGRL